MLEIAQVVHRDGLLMVPVHTGYEVDLLMEHVDWYAERQEKVWLQVAHSPWLVITHCNGDGSSRCSRCRDRRAHLSFDHDGAAAGPLCLRCARQEIEPNLKRRWWPL